MSGGNDWLAQRFEDRRGHLRRVAYRMLGSLGEAEDGAGGMAAPRPLRGEGHRQSRADG